MHALSQKCRPKHQVLVLKCYPRTTKGAVDVKPNSSELSYLLYYATSRRSKVQKVGSFLERKTASDVSRQRIGNVQVTLQIVEALIDKNPKDLPLFAPNVLKILDAICRARDITMVESSIPTFETFCAHHDASTLLADQLYLVQFEAVVRAYAAFASTRRALSGKAGGGGSGGGSGGSGGGGGGGPPLSKPMAMRWRSAGLAAIRAVAASDALSSLAGRQYAFLVPMVLENLWCDSDAMLDVLVLRAEADDKTKEEGGGGGGGGAAGGSGSGGGGSGGGGGTGGGGGDRGVMRRRNSGATVRTADTAGDTNPIALSGTAMDVDMLAEQDLGVLAMRCLQQIFLAPSRALIHAATTALLGFVLERIEQGEAVCQAMVGRSGGGGGGGGDADSGWAVKICGFLLRWAPVQERYIILVTVMDALGRTPLTDDTLDQHIALATMAGSLLQSDASLIGLSVMDVLLGFVQHIKRLVQMPGDPASVVATAAAAAEAPPPLSGRPDPRSPTTLAAIETATTTASRRKALLARLQQCIGDLATHVYYADQIADMVAAILYRLKPPRGSSSFVRGGGGGGGGGGGEKATEGHVENGEPAEAELSEKDPTEKEAAAAAAAAARRQQPAESLFSLTVAKTALLKSIKAILVVANPAATKGPNRSVSPTVGGGGGGGGGGSSSGHTLSRNRVPLQVWEGTHWLLRDGDGPVRKAYVDALLAWLDREVAPADQRARDESRIASSFPAPSTVLGSLRPTTRSGGAGGIGGALGRRAVSSENGQPPSGRKRRPLFLSLLHLAIFDNALQYVEYETDIVLLHVLLYKLVWRLGVNATRHGLPMVFQLQEQIQEVETPQAKIRLGSLVHGYFWTLTDKFRFEGTVVGQAIRNEVTRRRSKHFWVEGEGVHVPPPLLELVGTPGMLRPQPRMPLHEIETEALLPFDDRLSLVEHLCAGYHEAMAAGGGGGSGSPPQSPTAAKGLHFSSERAPPAMAGDEEEVPAAFREQMLSDWSRESVLQAQQAQQAALAAGGGGSKSVSLSGSRTTAGHNSSSNHYAGGRPPPPRLAVPNTSSGLAHEHARGGGGGGGAGGGLSPSASQPNLRSAAAAGAYTYNHDLLGPRAGKLRKSSVRSGLSPSPGGSLSSQRGGGGEAGPGSSNGGGGGGGGGGFVTSVDQLKLALAGAAVHGVSGGSSAGSRQGSRAGSGRPPATAAGGHGHGRRDGEEEEEGDDDGDDSSSDSMVSYDVSASEFSFNPPAAAAAGEGANNTAAAKKAASRRSSTATTAAAAAAVVEGGEAVPPVPPVPPVPGSVGGGRPLTARRRSVKSRAGEGGGGGGGGGGGSDGDKGADLQALLQGIDSRAGENGLGNLTQPPY